MRGDGNMDFLEFVNKDLPTIQGWCSADKALKFIEIINDIKPDLCLEIGVFGGSSLIPQAIALKENGKGLVYGIDPWCNHSAIEEMENQANKEWWGGLDLNQVYLHCKYNIERFGVEDYCKLLKNKSIDVIDLFADNSIDILHIDGNHCEKLAYEDSVNYFPKVKSGGYIFFDDISWSENGSEISTQKGLNFLRQYCEELGVVGKDCMVLQKN